MTLLSNQLEIDNFVDDQNAIDFCEQFFNSTCPKYILGRNEWARSIAEIIEVDGFVDDFTNEQKFLDRKIIKTQELPQGSLVVSAVVGIQPITVRQKIANRGVNQIDYFAFRKYSGKKLKPVMWWDEFQNDFTQCREKYEWVFSLLQDQKSRLEFTKILNFRLSSNLSYMEGFTDAQYRQYFEDFLALQKEGEVFFDVGGFDGYTSLEFIHRCPQYSGVHIFEPEPTNIEVTKTKLNNYKNIYFYPYGLSNRSQTLRFDVKGSSSRVSEQGNIKIKVEPLDDLLDEPLSFLKMDIEGGEIEALEGAKQTIIKYHPRLAISVYHRHDDFWRIPELILSYHRNYKIFLRYYTEGVTETVMFFVP
jgi:FkbM family methyltransferase